MADINLRVNGVNNAALHQFTSLQAAILHAATDHGDFSVTQGKINIKITTAIADSTAATVTGFTNATPDWYVNIFASAPNWTHGKWSTSKYRLQQSVGYKFPLQILTPYTRVSGLQIGVLYTGTTSYSCVVVAYATDVLVDSCLLRNDGTNTWYDAGPIRTANSPASVTVRNCVIFGQTTGGAAVQVATNTTMTVENCTIHVPNAQYGAYQVGTGVLNIYDTYLGGPATIPYGTVGMTKCATSDNSAPDVALRNISPGIDVGACFTNITPGAENYYVQVLTSPLIGAGGSCPHVTVDMIGNKRIGTNDIGAFERLKSMNAHPRLYFTSTLLTELRARVASNPAYYTTFKNYYDARIGSLARDSYAFNTWYQYAMSYALLYQITGDVTYGNRAVDYMKALLDDFPGGKAVVVYDLQTGTNISMSFPYGGIVGNGRGDDHPATVPVQDPVTFVWDWDPPGAEPIYELMCMSDAGYSTRSFSAIGIVRDWCHDVPTMTAELIDRAGRRLETWIEYIYDTSALGWDPGNYGAGHLAMLTNTLFGFWGDSFSPSSWERRMGNVWKRVSGVMWEQQGDFRDGWSYGPWAAMSWMGYPAVYHSATGSLAEWNSTTYHTDFVNAMMQLLHPSRQSMADHGRWPNEGTGVAIGLQPTILQVAGTAPLTAAQEGMLRWHAVNTFGQTAPATTGLISWPTVVYYDAAAPLVEPSKALLGSLTHWPRNWFENFVTRSADWSNTQATWVEMLAPSTFNAVESFAKGEVGSIKIAARGSLLVTHATAASAGQPSQEHNIPMISGGHLGAPQTDGRPNGSEHFRASWVDGVYAYMKFDPLQCFYDYNVIDCTYGSRSAFFLEPDYLLVYDNYTVVNAVTNTFKERWIFTESPTTDGSTVTCVRDAAKIVQTYINTPVTFATGNDIPYASTARWYADATPVTPSISNQLFMGFEVMGNTDSPSHRVVPLTVAGAKAVYVENATSAWVVVVTASTTGADITAPSLTIDLTGASPTIANPTIFIADLVPGTKYTITETSPNVFDVVYGVDGSITVDANGLLTYGVTGEPEWIRFSRPNDDIFDGLWTNQLNSPDNLFEAISETSYDDSTYIKSSPDPVDDYVKLGMSSVPTPTAGTIVLRVRAKWTEAT